MILSAVDGDFTSDPVSCISDSVSLLSTAMGGISPYTYMWSFGNGQTSNKANPTIKYDNTGIYNITLIVTDLLGCKDTTERVVSIENYAEEQWATRFNGTDSLRDMAVAIDADGSVYVAGKTEHAGDIYGIIIKYNAQGDEMWVTETFEPGVFSAMSIDEYGNVYVSGSIQNTSDMSIAKYNSSGQRVWQETYSSANSSDIEVDGLGNLYIAGSSQDRTLFTVLKYNNSGTLLWAQTFNNNNDPNILGIEAKTIVVTDTDVWATGYSSNNYLVTINYNAEGSVKWTQMYQHLVDDAIYVAGMDNDENNNLYLAIQTEGKITLIKYSSSGQLLSVNQHGASSSPAAIRVDKRHQNIYLTGRLNNSTHDGVLIKYNYAGVEQWENTLAQSMPGALPTLAIDTAGTVYTTQTTYSGALSINNADYITQSFSYTGQKQWEIKYDGPSHRADNAAGVAVDNNGNVYVTGSSFNLQTGYDMLTIRYAQCAVPSSQRVKQSPNKPIDLPFVQPVISESQLSIYPNPNNGEMTLNYFIPQNEISELTIYDVSGRKVKNYPLLGESNQMNISERDLNEGIYFYNVIANGKPIKQDKIIIVK